MSGVSGVIRRARLVPRLVNGWRQRFEPFAARPIETVRVRQAGGTIGDCTQSDSGQEPLIAGQRVLLFLTQDTQNPSLPLGYWVTGAIQGLWPIGPDDTVTSAYLPDYAGISLDAFAALVQAALAGEPPPDAPGFVPLEESPLSPGQ